VLVFKCKWVDSNFSVGTDDLDFTLVDLNKMNYTDEPFIMASQARQIFMSLIQPIRNGRLY